MTKQQTKLEIARLREEYAKACRDYNWKQAELIASQLNSLGYHFHPKFN